VTAAAATGICKDVVNALLALRWLPVLRMRRFSLIAGTTTPWLMQAEQQPPTVHGCSVPRNYHRDHWR